MSIISGILLGLTSVSFSDSDSSHTYTHSLYAIGHDNVHVAIYMYIKYESWTEVAQFSLK